MIFVVFLVMMLLLKLQSTTMGSASPSVVTPIEFVSTAFGPSIASVNIYNFVLATYIEKREVEVSCTGPGQRLLTFGGDYSWSFPLSNWGNEDVICAFDWGFKFQQFVVWVDPRDMLSHQPFKPCLHCVWDIRREGFFVSELGETPDNRVVYKWLTNI